MFCNYQSGGREEVAGSKEKWQKGRGGCQSFEYSCPRVADSDHPGDYLLHS